MKAELAQEKVQWWAAVNMIMKLKVPQWQEICGTSE
jgi:hypothetical protein